MSSKSSRLAFGLGLILLVLGLGLNWKQSQTSGEDFGHLYVIGKSLLRGFDIYTARDLAAAYTDLQGAATYAPWGIFNSPSAGLAMLPLAALPLDLAKAIWFVFSCVVLIAGVDQLLRHVAPRLPLGYRVLVLGALMCTSAARWGFLYLQGAPLMFGLLCLFIVALARNRRVFALVIAAFVVCLKLTLGLPFIGLAFLQRRYWLVAAVAAVWVLANGLGFLRVGGIDAVVGYQQNMTHLEQPDQLNYPDFRAPTSMQRLDWPYLLNAISPDLPRSSAAGTLLSALSLGWLFWQWRRTRFAADDDTLLAFLGPLACLSLLSVYHHHYDAIALFAPAIVYLSQPVTLQRRGLVALFVVPVVLFAGLYPVGEAQGFVERVIGPGSGALLKLLGVVSVTIAFAASLLLLRDFVRRRELASERAYDARGITGDHGAWRHIARDYRAGGHHRVVADTHTLQHDAPVGQPDPVLDRHR